MVTKISTESGLAGDLKKVKRRLIARAHKRFPDGVFPSGSRQSLNDCFYLQFGLFGILDDEIQLHYNDRRGSSHIESEPMPKTEGGLLRI